MANKQIELTTPTVRTKGSASKPLLAIWLYRDNSLVIAHLDFMNTERYVLWHAPKSHQLNFDEPGDLNHELFTLGMEVPDQLDRVLPARSSPSRPRLSRSTPFLQFSKTPMLARILRADAATDDLGIPRENTEMNDANGFADRIPGMSGGSAAAGRPSYRHDGGVGSATSEPDSLGRADSPGWARIERVWWLILGGCDAGLLGISDRQPRPRLLHQGLRSLVPGGPGRAAGAGYLSRPETGRLFPFMYPPSAAAMLAWVSMLGATGSLLALVVVNSAAWLASIVLSVWLAVKPGTPSPAGRDPSVAADHRAGS